MSDLKLIDAVRSGDSATAAMLIESQTDINQQDEQGWTPLNFAAGKGDLSLVKLLVEHGADVFKVGRDLRTPYMIALAAGRVSVAKYLREVEDNYLGEKPTRLGQKYCKAYPLEELRKYQAWSESQINWKKENDGSNNGDEGSLTDNNIVFIHQDFTVTESVYHDENVIFNDASPGWKEFCTNSLEFKVPDELDLIVQNEGGG